MTQAPPTAAVSWLLDDLVRRVQGIRHGIVLSRDGLKLGASRDLSREDAEHLAAVAAGLQSLARGGARHFGGGDVRQTIIEMQNQLLFVIAAGEGSCLAVLCPADAEAGLIAYEMALFVKRLGQHLAANPRPGATGAVAEGTAG